jgi:hypothetical protein
MNAPTTLLIPKDDLIESFNKLKLKTLDAFYALDVALEDWLQDVGLNCQSASTGCRVKALKTADFPSDVATKAQARYLASLSLELTSAIEMRNLVVHSQASFGHVVEQPMIFLKPVGLKYVTKDCFVHIEHDHIESAIKVAHSVAKKISAWRKQREDKQASAINPAS